MHLVLRGFLVVAHRHKGEFQMKIRPIFEWGMYNWAILPIARVWRNPGGGGGFAIHFLRGRLGFWM